MNRLKPLRIGSFQAENNVFTAPMAGITDLPFRELCRRFGAGLTYTEMVSAKGMYYGSKNTRALLDIDTYGAVQLFGSDPDILASAARSFNESERVVVIDINMGCPAPKIVKNGEGSALMKEPALVGRIVRAVSGAAVKPVTVKIRKGFGGSDNAVEIAKIAEENGAKCVTVHGRTREQFYEGCADWNAIAAVKRAVSVPVIGNGDVFSPQAAAKMLDETGCDGVMVARGAQGNPWLFRQITHYLSVGELLPEPNGGEKINTALAHAQRLIAYKGEYVGVREARKHMCWYIKGMHGAAEAKTRINQAVSYTEIEEILRTKLY